MVRLLGLLQTPAVEEGKPLRIRLAAPTGKAAARLSESIGKAVSVLPVSATVREAIPTDVSTLHRLLGSRPDSRNFIHQRDKPLELDVLVVDEASMIDLEMMACLLDALPRQARLILLGDKDQLASVDAGSVLGDLCREAEKGRLQRADDGLVEHPQWRDAWCARFATGSRPGRPTGAADRHAALLAALRPPARSGAWRSWSMKKMPFKPAACWSSPPRSCATSSCVASMMPRSLT